MSVKHAIEAYEWALANGIAKEQARAVLPEGMTVSRMYMSGSIRSFVHYVGLRSGNGTQLEHQRIAVDCGKALRPYFPELEGVL
jgi:thymidylate synthase (FAD)